MFNLEYALKRFYNCDFFKCRGRKFLKWRNLVLNVSLSALPAPRQNFVFCIIFLLERDLRGERETSFYL